MRGKFAGAGTERLYRPADTLYGSSWYLRNGTTPGIDANVTRVWDDYTGVGVSVGVYDDAIDYTHADLDGNYDASKQLVDAAPRNLTQDGDPHGTAVAGIIAAENNGTGTVGVAFDSKITGIPILRSSGASSMLTSIDAMSRFDVANHSWGYIGIFADNFSAASSYWDSFEAGLDKAATLGRGGLGTVIVKAAGNDRAAGHDTNHSNFSNDRHSITVGAIDSKGNVTSFSTPGASILVSAPGYGLQTTDMTGANGYNSTDYMSFAGTSAAAPVVSGVAALILDANPNLGWRDVQEIFAYSSRHVGSAVGGARTGYEKYGWTINDAKNWNGGGLHFSNDYGFGLVDALAAVRLAETWAAKSVSSNELSASVSASPAAAIPDLGSVSRTLTLGTNLRIDHVELSVNISHLNRGDLTIRLTSPDGTVSTLLERSLKGADTGDNIVFKLSSNAFWGETSGGNWTVTVSDAKSGNVGTVNSLALKVFGDAPGANDSYIYTNEYAKFGGGDGRDVLSDSGGADTLNAAAVSTGSIIDLTPGAVSTIAGRALTIASTTVIEAAHGGDGEDVIAGNDAANTLQGWRGDDRLTGGKGDDLLNGGDGIDTAVYAGARLRYLVVSDGEGGWYVTDTLGIEGKDRLTKIEQLQFADTLVTFESASAGVAGLTLTGGTGNDILSGRGGNDTLLGMAGNDTLDGASGSDTMTGGSGNDTYYVDDARDVVVELASQGTDTVRATLASYTLGLNVENLYLDGAASAEGVGNTGSNSLYGNVLDNRLTGLAGNDTLDGKAGNDTMIGGTGNDVYYVDCIGDAVIELAGEGTDLVNSAISYRLGATLENLTLTGSLAINGTGNAVANSITGNSGANTLYGDAGNDSLYGKAGNDRLEGGDGNDMLEGGTGADTLVGGAGADRFDWNSAADAGVGATRDVILDFLQGQDGIDLAGIDSNGATTTNDVFSFIGAAAFTGIAGELRYQHMDGLTLVQGDTNGDMIADFEIALQGQLVSLQATDFTL